MNLANKLSEDMAIIIAMNNEYIFDGYLNFFSSLNIEHSISLDDDCISGNANNIKFVINTLGRSHIEVYQELFYKTYYSNLLKGYK
ncbi:TPA: hypothetical protein ACX6SS_003166 [Photobacterium damselae]